MKRTIQKTIIFCSVVTLQTFSSLIHQWNLGDSNSSIVTDNISNNHGSIVGTPLFQEAGINDLTYSKSIKFDGISDGITVNSVQGLSEFTMTFWMKAEKAGGCPVAKSNYNNPWSLELNSNSDNTAKLKCWINDFSTQRDHFNSAINLNEWTHITLTINKNSDILKLFINGKLSSLSKGLDNYNDNGSVPLTFGKRNDGAFFKGSLCGISLFNRELEASLIDSIFISESGFISKEYPSDGTFLRNENNTISWNSNPQSVASHFYLGSSEADVENASTLSEEYKGTLSTSIFYYNSFQQKTTYFWRVDEEYENNLIVKGRVKSFTYGDPAELFLSYGNSALEKLNNLFLKNGSSLYVNDYDAGTQSDIAFVWGQTVGWFAINAAAEATGAQNDIDNIKNNFYPTFYNRYRYYHNNLWGYNAYSNTTGSADRYIDDNGHIVIALLELYDLTNDYSLVEEAKVIMEFIMHYENDALGLEGMPWHENNKNQEVNGVASTLTTQASLMLYSVTNDNKYLQLAHRNYDYFHENGLVRDDGITYEGMNSNFEINRGFLSYVTDYFIESDLLFYEIYNDDSYLEMAIKRAEAIYYERIDKNRGALMETGQWGGYTHIRALKNLYKANPEQKWQNMIFRILKFIHDNGNDNNLYGERWDHEYSDLHNTKVNILSQASPVIGFMLAADPDLWINENPVSIINSHKNHKQSKLFSANLPKIQLTKGKMSVSDISNKAQLQMVNLKGQTLLYKTLEPNALYNFDLAHYGKGMYIFRLVSGKSIKEYKLLLNK